MERTVKHLGLVGAGLASLVAGVAIMILNPANRPIGVAGVLLGFVILGYAAVRAARGA
jgi:hypothetical protein